MKILVTGATGFIGQHTIRALLRQGHEVVATSTSREKAARQSWFNQVTFLEYDIARPELIQNLFDLFGQPDVLIHLAWPDVARPQAAIHVQHLFAQYAFLEKLILDGLRRLTVAGTCFEYGLQSGSLSEMSLAAPITPYGVAKDSLRKFLTILQTEHVFTLTWLRLFYMYGEGQHPNSLFAQLEEAMSGSATSFNMSGGEQLRDYLPVADVADLVSRLAVLNTGSGLVNCCSGKPISVRRLVESYLHERRATISLNLGHYPYRDFEPMAFWGTTDILNDLLRQ